MLISRIGTVILIVVSVASGRPRQPHDGCLLRLEIPQLFLHGLDLDTDDKIQTTKYSQD